MSIVCRLGFGNLHDNSAWLHDNNLHKKYKV